jgi:hypothetical protein
MQQTKVSCFFFFFSNAERYSALLFTTFALSCVRQLSRGVEHSKEGIRHYPGIIQAQ